MKKVIYSLVLVSLFFGGLSSCKSNAEKHEDALEEVQEANQELNEVEEDQANAEANKIEWEAFKQDVNAKISKNEERIDELNADIKKQGNKLDATYQRNVDELHKKNENLKAKLNDWETNKKTDWESFKREFNSDMSDLGNALQNFTLNNKK